MASSDRHSSGLTRREFLWMASLSAAGLLVGCAVNPVTGQKELMLVSEDQEIQVDREGSPHQFSADYGPVQDAALNRYVSDVGSKLAARSHRSQLPYSFRAVNATYVNAYAFPAGSIAATRGILLELDSEAELAALLGHEIGHVNARHTAQQMTTSTLTGMAVALGTAVAGAQDPLYGTLAAGLGGIGASALLAKYSRDDERQADALGMEYMARAEYSPEGMVGLMEVLNRISRHQPSAIETMFATHPMSAERLQTAQGLAASKYAYATAYPVHRERYMDATAGLRRIKGAIEAMQNGEKAMAQKRYSEAEAQYQSALKQAPGDYAALVMMAKCQFAQGRPDAARGYARQATEVYPQEAQAHYLYGLALMEKKDYDSAYTQFGRYEQLLPGNPATVFLKGYALEGMQRREQAAQEYYRYLQTVNQGREAIYARQRLVQWGYLR